MVKACLTNDSHAQKSLYDQFAPKMFGVCLRYCKRHEEAEDMLQEAMFKVFVDLHQFQNKGSLEGWIRKVVVRTILMEFRKKKIIFDDIDDQHILLADHGHQAIFDKFEQEAMIDLLRLLPEACRLVFNLYVMEGYSHQEIAEALQITTGTTKSQLFRARSILKKYFDQKNIVNKS